MKIAGFNIVKAVYLTKTVTRIVDRTWKERWFSLPWHPLQKRKTIVETIPDTEMYVGGDTIFIHPATFEKFLESLGDSVIWTKEPCGRELNITGG